MITLLPENIALGILSYLTPFDIGNASRVSILKRISLYLNIQFRVSTFYFPYYLNNLMICY